MLWHVDIKVNCMHRNIDRMKSMSSQNILFVPGSRNSDTLAPSYLNLSSSKSGKVAELAASNKCRKYRGLLEQNYLILPFAVETLGGLVLECNQFHWQTRQNDIISNWRKNAKSYLKQRINLVIQRSNAAIVMATIDV